MDLTPILLQHFAAIGAEKIETVQSLWSGYGELARYQLHYQDNISRSASPKHIIVKWIAPPDSDKHPRGWHTDIGHQRKLTSYQVEANWYQKWAIKCIELPAIPACYGVITPNKDKPEESLIIMSDLDTLGYFNRPSSLSPQQAKPCLAWLAQFHSASIVDTDKTVLADDHPKGLWPIGCYWHLATRTQELERMPESALKDAAWILDDRLNNTRFTSLVHGDAKLANFCFNHDASKVAGVDFQYTGAGCGVRDLCYFLGSVFNEQELEEYAALLTDYYFSQLKLEVANKLNLTQVTELEREWRGLVPTAWADFERFLIGWSPGHKKLNGYSAKMTQLTLKEIDKES